MFLVTRLFICFATVALTIYGYIERNNRLTALRIIVPELAKKLKNLEEENTRLHFEIEKFENPLNLMQLAKEPQFAHLKQPYTKDILSFESEPNAIAAK